jgi:hypothetical protein
VVDVGNAPFEWFPIMAERQPSQKLYLHPSTTVVTGTANSAAIFRHDMPYARSRTASSRRNTRLGRPNCFPFALAVLQRLWLRTKRPEPRTRTAPRSWSHPADGQIMRVNLSEEQSWLYGGGSITLGNGTGMTDSGRARGLAIVEAGCPGRRRETANHRLRPINGLCVWNRRQSAPGLPGRAAS